MKLNQDILDGRVRRILGRARERRGIRARNYRETMLGKLAETVGALQEQRGMLVERLDRVSIRLASSIPESGRQR
jgi:hypothetical protein